MAKIGHKPVYLDYAATTPLSIHAAKAMEPYWREQFYNPSALYEAAHTARQGLQTARAQIMGWLGAQVHQLVFTSGATEANNLVLQSTMKRYPEARILTSSIEHASIRIPVAGYDHDEVRVNANGALDLSHLEERLSDEVVLVSIIHASNELGTVQPIASISKILTLHRQDRLRRGIQLPLLLHIDAAQSVSCLDLHVNRLGVDLMTLSAHKHCGPKGIGGLFAKNPHELTPIQRGGSQEWGLRSGTEALPLIIGFATAFDRAQRDRKQTIANLTAKRNQLLSDLRLLPGVTQHASDARQVLPGIVNFRVAGCDGERLVLELDRRGFQVGTGAACSAGSEEPSHILRAIGLSKLEAQSSLRVSFGSATPQRDLKRFTKALADLV